MADSVKKSTADEPKFVSKVTKRIGSDKDGSPKIEVRRGQDLGNLSKDDQDIYRKYKIID